MLNRFVGTRLALGAGGRVNHSHMETVREQGGATEAQSGPDAGGRTKVGSQVRSKAREAVCSMGVKGACLGGAPIAIGERDSETLEN